MKNSVEIGKRLRKLRGHLSQREFAKLLEIPFRTYQNHEYGKSIPKPDMLSKIAQMCGTTIDWIITGRSGFSAGMIKVREAISMDDIIRGKKQLIEYLTSKLDHQLSMVSEVSALEKSSEDLKEIERVRDSLYLLHFINEAGQNLIIKNGFFRNNTQKGIFLSLLSRIVMFFEVRDESKIEAIKALVDVLAKYDQRDESGAPGKGQKNKK